MSETNTPTNPLLDEITINKDTPNSTSPPPFKRNTDTQLGITEKQPTCTST
ncbi:37_t:CDS:2 [Dentiscutata heterogama]|uniref:37_t:CDS:1 n=1 Tax=Dentiscutata heterogama TaxID=1316150 RepID=A0ACA9KY75_9GLOM|nr:37_t:CDS:2 [Dentiscutata heterogama]